MELKKGQKEGKDYATQKKTDLANCSTYLMDTPGQYSFSCVRKEVSKLCIIVTGETEASRHWPREHEQKTN